MACVCCVKFGHLWLEFVCVCEGVLCSGVCVCVCVCVRGGVLCSGAWCVLKGLFGELFVMGEGSLGNLFCLGHTLSGCAAYCSGDPTFPPKVHAAAHLQCCHYLQY